MIGRKSDGTFSKLNNLIVKLSLLEDINHLATHTWLLHANEVKGKHLAKIFHLNFESRRLICVSFKDMMQKMFIFMNQFHCFDHLICSLLITNQQAACQGCHRNRLCCVRHCVDDIERVDRWRKRVETYTREATTFPCTSPDFWTVNDEVGIVETYKLVLMAICGQHVGNFTGWVWFEELTRSSR